MDNILWVAFITGLTTGGLSCMLVQGGLVTSSLASRIESDLIDRSSHSRHARGAIRQKSTVLAQPLLIFLAAKIVAYTLLGFLLGSLGSVLSLTPVSRGILQIAIAIYMVGNGLRMLNVHPIFRIFSFEPPSFITRFIRRKAKNGNSNFTPLFLGVLTIFIPCGVTQSMMALAIGTGSALTGALIMFSFTLGTSPVFFGLTYLATRLGALAEKQFTRIVAVALLILGLITFDSGLTLTGSSYTLSRIPAAISAALSPANSSSVRESTQTSGEFGVQSEVLTSQEDLNAGDLTSVIDLHATNSGYSPKEVSAPAGKTITLNLITNNTVSCSRAFDIPALNFSTLLPKTGIQSVEIPPQEAGTTLRFTCSMGMYTGVIVFQ